ncbi:Uncharacterised protein [Streptococcus constellatus]|jgi:hypothetical protein|uniref:Uncharacterized protein n=1 Tax=Streptococcus constellatus TaxID=76860 RepID=A0A564U2H4_STRCV|nr:Uncharacterised protein [Streptococcus gordonii]VUX13687.1 Uncharacterised protein [Streptococcus constellatus]DAV77291.1 MAG TPA: Protein of unknown function (DUF1056) [Caudoviricetes sp.]
MKWFFNNIHTLFLIAAMFCVGYGVFLVNTAVGFIVTGLMLFAVAIYIDRNGR